MQIVINRDTGTGFELTLCPMAVRSAIKDSKEVTKELVKSLLLKNLKADALKI